MIVHWLPLWFLIFSLFLPRIALIVAWFDRDLVHFHLGNTLIPPLLALLVPRILILFLIYQDQGFSTWFLIHAVALLLAWGRRRSPDQPSEPPPRRRLSCNDLSSCAKFGCPILSQPYRERVGSRLRQ